MGTTEGPGDPVPLEAEVEVEMLGVDRVLPLDSPKVPQTAQGQAQQQTSLITGQASVGGRRTLLRTVAGAAVAIAAIVGLLVGLDRAAPDPPPERAAFEQPSGLVITTTVPPTTTRQAVLTVPTTIAGTTLPPDEFLLGEQTGLWLFFGGDTTLRRLNVDNGEMVDFGIRAIPTITTGEDLVLYLRGVGLVGWIPTGTPGEPPVWKSGYAARADEPGQLWILDPDEETSHSGGEVTGYGRWALFETESSRILERRPGDLYQTVEDARPDRATLPSSAAALRAGPALTARPDGLSVYGDDQYQTTFDGKNEVLAYNDERILIRSCETEPCVTQWIGWSINDRTATELPGSQPDDLLWADFVAEGRWLLVYYRGGESELIEVDGVNRIRFPAGANPTMSDDGRWIALHRDGQYAIIETATGNERYRFGLNSLDGPPGDVADPGANGLLFATNLDLIEDADR